MSNPAGKIGRRASDAFMLDAVRGAAGVAIDLDGWDDPSEEERTDPSVAMVAPARQQLARRDTAVREGTQAAEFAGLRAVVAEPDAAVAAAISASLRSRGAKVEWVERGLQLMRVVRLNRPDLVLMEAHLPELHGFAVIEKLRDHPRCAHIATIIVSSAYRGWRVARDMRRIYHVDGLVEKPVDEEHLVRTVHTVLHRRLGRPAQRRRQLFPAARRAYRRSIEAARRAEIDVALAACREGLLMDPSAVELHLQHGVLLLNKPGLTHQAMVAFEQALLHDPSCFAAMRSLATLYEEEGLTNMALDMWERALRSAHDEQLATRIRKHLLTLL